MIATKALTPPLPSKILIPRLITLQMTILRTITPPMHLMRKCPPPIPVYITSHVRSSVKSIRASRCCWIWCLGSLKFVDAHFVGADVGAAAIAVGGGAVFVVVVGVGAEALYSL